MSITSPQAGHYTRVIAFLLAAASASAMLACPPARAAPNVPAPGQVLEGIRPEPGMAQPSRERLEIRRRQQRQLPADTTLQVSRIKITGDTVFAASRLHKLVADAEGRTLSLAELQDLAARVTAFYRQRGYLLSRAYIPAQTITDGVVRITVLEGSLESVSVDDQVGLGGFALAPVKAIPTDTPLTADQLQRGLLMAAALPGVNIDAILAPGDTVGTSGLNVAVTPGERVTGSVRLDNHGNEVTGRLRTRANVRIANPLSLGDSLGLTALVSEDGLWYLRGAYQVPVTPWGTRAGIQYAHLEYELDEAFEPLDAGGAVDIAAAWLRHPLIRSRDFNLYADLRYEHKALQSHIDAFDTDSETRLRNAVVGFHGNLTDSLGAGGRTAFALHYTIGDVDLAQPSPVDIDGTFGKLNLELRRLQYLTHGFSFYLAYRGQYTNDNLVPAEQMALGGAYRVRAYPQGAVSADIAHLLTAELRYRLPRALPGRWQAVAFVDQGFAQLNADPYANTDNHREITDAGVGLNVAAPGGWRFETRIAWAVGDNDPAGDDYDDDPPRAWFIATKYF